MNAKPQGEIEELGEAIALRLRSRGIIIVLKDALILADALINTDGWHKLKPSPGPTCDDLIKEGVCLICGTDTTVTKKDQPNMDYPSASNLYRPPKGWKMPSIEFEAEDCQPKVWPARQAHVPDCVSSDYTRGVEDGANAMHDAFMAVINGGKKSK